MTERRSTLLLAAVLGGSGVLHFTSTSTFAGLIPDRLGDADAWVWASGAAELLCAAGLLSRRTRVPAAWASAALFVAVFPGNVQMAIDWSDRSFVARAVAYGRLPLQLPLIWWAVAEARAAGSRTDGSVSDGTDA